MSLEAQQITVAALLLAIGGAGLKKLWVWGWTYADRLADIAELKKDRDFWRDTALKALGHVDKALEVVQGRQSGG